MSDIVKVDEGAMMEASQQKDVTEGIPKTVMENLDSQMLKFIRMEVGTNFTEKKLCEIVGIPKRRLTKWKQDPDFVLVRSKLKANVFQADVQRDRAQNQMIKDKMFVEVMSRFEEPDPENDLEEGYTEKDYERYMRRFASQSEFDKLMKSWHDADKRSKEDTMNMDDDIVTDTDVFINRIRNIAHKKQMAHKKRMEQMGHENVDFNVLFSLNTVVMNKDGTFPKEESDRVEDIVDAEWQDIDMSSIDVTEDKNE